MADDNEEGTGEFEYSDERSLGGHDFTDLEESSGRQPKPKASEFVIDDEEAPEDLRGKSAADVLAELKRAREALRISEDARLALVNSQEALTDARKAPVAAPIAAPDPDPELTDEQLDALYEESPRKHAEYLQQRTETRLMRAVEQRVAPLAGSSSALMLRDAESRYPDEFAVFGKDIQNFISSMPDKSALSNPKAMDDLVDYMRGKNYKKFEEYRLNKNKGDIDEARDSMRRETPPGFERQPRLVGGSGGGGRKGGVQLDQTQREVAAALGLSEAEYAEGIPANQRRGVARG